MNITKMPPMTTVAPSSLFRSFLLLVRVGCRRRFLRAGALGALAPLAALGPGACTPAPSGSASGADATADASPHAVTMSSDAAPSPSASSFASVLAAMAARDAGLPPLAPLDDAKKSAMTAYRKALGNGRELTRKKDYPGAIKAFDEALAAMKGDPRALAERGFARLQAKDYKGALRDLNDAQALAPSAELEAQIWYNIGQAEEGLGHDEAARHAFVMVQNTRPTAAAAKHLIGKSQCDAQVVREPAPGKVYPSWLAAWRGFEAGGAAMWNDGAKPSVTTNDAAKKAICGDDCKEGAPFVATVGDTMIAAELALVAPQSDGKLLVFHHLGDAMGGRCASSDHATIDPGTPLHVRVTSEPMSLMSVEVDAHGTVRECERERDLDTCKEGCFIETWTERDYFFDLAAKKQILMIEQGGREAAEGKHARTVGVARKPDGLLVKGGGCDQTVPLASAP